VPLSDIEVSFDFPHKIQSVTLIPDQRDLPISKDHTKQFVTIPKFETHCALVFHYL
jgi:hypothetical protein